MIHDIVLHQGLHKTQQSYRSWLLTLDEMDEQTFNTMMETGYQQAINGETISVEEAFDEIRKRL